MPRAEASGSRGSRTSAPGSGAFDASTPADAQTKPWRVSAITSGPRVDVVSAQIEDIFSAQYKYYSRVPAGRVVIRNNGSAPVQKMKVLFETYSVIKNKTIIISFTPDFLCNRIVIFVCSD